MKEWIGCWSASPQAPYSEGISNEGFTNETIRMIIQPHLNGKALKLRLSNTFGTIPLTFADVHVAISEEGANIIPGTDKQVTFGGEDSITIPVGSAALSAPIPLHITSDHKLTVSLYIPGFSGPTTWHSPSNQTSYVSSGNHTADTKASSFEKEFNAWFWLDSIDVKPEAPVSGAIVTLSNSITDGYNSTLNANHRWPDFLAKRLKQESPERQMAVLNQGISGNEMLDDSDTSGVSALSRINRDVLSQTGVTDVILLEGINDIGNNPHTFYPERIIAAMKQIISQVHEKGIKIYGGTLTPFKGAKDDYYTPQGEDTRQEVNHWIRNSNAFDGVIDFDKAIRDPKDIKRMLAKYDSGDHLHPNDAGYKEMANTVDLRMFRKKT